MNHRNRSGAQKTGNRIASRRTVWRTSVTAVTLLLLTLSLAAPASASGPYNGTHVLSLPSARGNLELGDLRWDDNWFHNDKSAVLLIGAGSQSQRTSTPAAAFAWCNHKNRFGNFDRTTVCLKLAQTEATSLRNHIEYYLGGAGFVNSCESYAKRRLLQDRAGAWTVRFARSAQFTATIGLGAFGSHTLFAHNYTKTSYLAAGTVTGIAVLLDDLINANIHELHVRQSYAQLLAVMTSATVRLYRFVPQYLDEHIGAPFAAVYARMHRTPPTCNQAIQALEMV